VTAGAGVTGRARPRRLFNGSLKCSANVFLSVYVTFLAAATSLDPIKSYAVGGAGRATR